MTDYSWTPLRKTISGTPTRTSHKISSARATSLVMGNVAQKYVFSCVRLCNKADKIIITNGWHTGNFIGSFIDNFIGSFLNQSDRQRSMIELTGDVMIRTGLLLLLESAIPKNTWKMEPERRIRISSTQATSWATGNVAQNSVCSCVSICKKWWTAT